MTEKFDRYVDRVLRLAVCVHGHGRRVEIKLLASNAVKEAYGQLLPAYEKASGNKVTVSWSGTADIIKRVNGGEIADAVIITECRASTA